MCKGVKLDNGVVVKGATLLNDSEAKNLHKGSREIGDRWWWLRSPGQYRDNAAYVGSGGHIDSNGCYVNGSYGAVRPALIISIEDSSLKVGDKFDFGDRKFEIVLNDRALCTAIIGDCAFRRDSKAADANDYEKSDVKKFIDNWYMKQVRLFAEESSREDSSAVTLENGLRVTGATLLTAEETEELQVKIRKTNGWWWLRSPGDRGSFAAGVSSDGSVDYYGSSVDSISGAVRPALDIQNLESSDLNIGDQFDFGNRKFEIISDTKALCTESIGKCAFREDWKAEDANNYEASNVKKFVDDWYKGIASSESETTVARLYTLDEFLAIIHDIPSSSVQNCESASELAELIKNVVDNGGKGVE